METTRTPIRNIAMRFAEIVDEVGKRLHIGCVMAAGQDWVEVSVPERLQLDGEINVRFLPSQETHRVDARWRASDRVGLTYAAIMVLVACPLVWFGLPAIEVAIDTRPAAGRPAPRSCTVPAGTGMSICATASMSSSTSSSARPVGRRPS